MEQERLRFDWDDANRLHFKRHGVTSEEAEQAILDPHAIFVEIESSGEEIRTKIVGLTLSGRVLTVVFSHRVTPSGPLPLTRLRDDWNLNTFARDLYD